LYGYTEAAGQVGCLERRVRGRRRVEEFRALKIVFFSRVEMWGGIMTPRETVGVWYREVCRKH
jgi:hypothetical protein